LDIVLPNLGGIDVIQRLKQTPQTRHIPIIAVTALARSEERKEFLQMGCSDCIYKPYSLNDLEARLQQRFTQHHLTQMWSAS
jgi:two-component system, cell cycle response regulator DivK